MLPRKGHAAWLGMGRWFMAALAVCAWGCGASASPIAFERHDIQLGGGPGQVVLAGFLLDGVNQDIAVIDPLGDGRRRLRVFAFEEGVWAPGIDAELPGPAAFMDILNVAGRDRLIAHQTGQLSWFDPEAGAFRPLAPVPAAYGQLAGRELAHVVVSRDLNGDGLEDLAVPYEDAFQVLLQDGAGEFSEAVAIGPPPGVGRLYELDGYRFDPWAWGRVHRMDQNLDGRPDLVFWTGRRFAAHLQQNDGAFAAEATYFSTDVAFDADELTWLAEGHWDFQDGSELQGRVLHALDDLNGDGIGDLAIIAVKGDSLFAKHTAYEVRFGARGADGHVAFGQVPDTVIPSDGMQLGLARHDVDGDGRIDMMFTTFDPHLLKAVGKIVGALLTGGMSFDVELWRLAERAYPETPDARLKVRADSPSGEPPGGLATALRSRAKGEPSHPRPPYPSVLLGDVTGDGHAELLMQRGRKALHVFEGTPGQRPFRRKPHKVAVAMPADHEFTWLTDLNADGKADVLMHHAIRPPRPDGDEDADPVTVNEVTILMAR